MKTQTLKTLSAFLIALLMTAGSARAAETLNIKNSKASLYTDISDQGVYYELTQFFHLDRLYRKLFRKKVHAQDINVYDEVPDSAFFTNRHGRETMPIEALVKGPSENEGPAEGQITVFKGKAEGLNPGFFVADSRGDKYLLKFDSIEHMELNSAAEVIACRFYHAIGYNVPQYTIFTFDPEKLVPAPDATLVDRSGFKKKLTPELLEEFLFQLPRDKDGRLRASASKILNGEVKGAFSFQGRRKDDPDDTIDHERLRSLRGLQVFSSWLNNNDVRRQNTLDVLVTENGKPRLKHYLIDFNSTLGGSTKGSKPPMLTHEYLPDYGEASKNVLSLGMRKSDWQKRWEENGNKENASAALGYVDNKYFYPEKFKVQLSYYVFKDMTRADAFWAAKIIRKFTDEEIRAMLKPGQYSSQEDEDFIFRFLTERREAVTRYWFSQSSPLDNFRFENGKLSFADLETQYKFAPAEGSVYSAEAFSGKNKKENRLGSADSTTPSIEMPAEWTKDSPLALLIRVKRPSEKNTRPFVLVEINDGRITRVLHQD